MEGYEVISSCDDKSIGHVSGQIGEFVIVEHGTLRRTHNPLPLEFTTVDDANKQVVTTLAHDIVYDAPPVKDGELDQEAAARHYGVAEAPAGEAAEQERAEVFAEVSSGQAATDHAGGAEQAPALLGDRQPREMD